MEVREGGWRHVILARAPAEVPAETGTWLVAAPHSGALGAARTLASRLAARGRTVVLAGGESEDGVRRVDPEDRDSWRALAGELAAESGLAGVVLLGGGFARAEDWEPDALRRELSGSLASALALVQGLDDAEASPGSGVFLVTRGGQALGDEPGGGLPDAALWGFGRVAARELGALALRLVDLDPAAADPLKELEGELLAPDGEPEVAYREGRRHRARLARSGGRVAPPSGSAWRLAPDPGGSLAALGVEPAARLAAGPDEVRVAVEASGLNFHDVLVGMGLVDVGMPLGGEMCGRVLEVGEGVTEFSEGDRVVGFAPGAFSPEVVTSAELLGPAPEGYPAAALATLPVVFVTAALAFEFGAPPPGGAVLVHAGAGGVGHAAIRLARAAGFRVFATASAPKHDYVRSLGAEGVFDSRSPSFGKPLLAATKGAGVRMVLNSLTGEGFIEASLSCLADGGRFVEIGKRGIWSAAEMAAARPDVSYCELALDRLQMQDPARVGSVLRGVLERVRRGELEPLPYRRYPLAEAGRAMETMREARHVGKLVFATSALSRGGLRGDRSYLVTGGFGGIGLRVAEWLGKRGAGAVVLNGRRAPHGTASAAVEQLRSAGVRVEVALADVTDGEAVERLVSGIGGDSGLPPLGGVIHCAGVLSDKLLPDQDWPGFERVLWPKVLGACHLHRVTAGLDLELFVLFSSLAGVVGNPGQANYAAANAFLDRLAHYRRSLGLPGQAIQWGPWSGAGMAEATRGRAAALAESSAGWLAPEQGIEALERVVREDIGTVAVGVFDSSAPEGAQLPLLAELVPAGADDASGRPADLVARLGELEGAAERERLLMDFLGREVQSVLRLPGPPLPETGFFDLGMDSLTVLDLRNRINRALAGEYAVSNTAMFDHPSPLRLARHMQQRLTPPAGDEVALPAAADRAFPAAGDRTFPAAGDRTPPAAARKPPAPDEDLSVDDFVRMLTDLDDDDV